MISRWPMHSYTIFIAKYVILELISINCILALEPILDFIFALFIFAMPLAKEDNVCSLDALR